MEAQEITCETLRRILELERMNKVRKNRALTKLAYDFYSKFSEYLKKLWKELEEASDAQKAVILKEELARAKRLFENIYSEREEKIVNYALSAAKGGNPDIKLLTTEENILYKELLASLMKARSLIFGSELKKEEKMSIPALESYRAPLSREGYVVVKALADLSFIGIDEVEYNIHKNDVISLPKATAELLCKGNKAELIATNI
jgi:DNA replication initiation complex subunit (GINS family)